MSLIDAAEYERRLQFRAAEVLPDVDIDATAAIYNVMRLSNAVGQDLEQTVHRPNGSTRAGFKVMLGIWVMGPLNQRELASYSNVTAASMSSVLNTLEDSALIERTRGQSDRRTVTIALTEVGTKTVTELYRQHLEREAEWLNGLPLKKKRQLATIARDLLDHRPSLE